MSDKFASSADALLTCVPLLSINISSSGRSAGILKYKLIRGESVWARTRIYASEICTLKLRENLHFTWEGLNAISTTCALEKNFVLGFAPVKFRVID